MFGKGLIKGLGITFKHTFEMDITVQYPEEVPFLQERYRGSLAFQFDKCIACGLCIKTCPNRVLTLETFKDEGAKKKKVLSYTIDRQYCMWCNLCVEICPTATLYFSHNFELTKFNREDIKVVYLRPPEVDLLRAEPAGARPEAGQEVNPITVGAAEEASIPVSDADAKRLKQVEAVKMALAKNPQKALAKLLEGEDDIALLAGVVSGDEKKLSKLAELMIDDRDKAHKLASALVSKAKKDAAAEGGPA